MPKSTENHGKRLKRDLEVSIIILNYNGMRFIKKLIESLEKQSYPKHKYEIIIADNGSSDGSVEYIEDIFPHIKMIKNEKNYGFSKGNNIPISSSKSKYVFLINNDSWVHKDALNYLVRTMDSHPEAGCCGADEYYYGDNILKPKGPVRETVWIGAGATIYRKKALDQVGLLDEEFFADWEDVDLSFRLKINGWKTYQDHRVIWYHAGKDPKRKFSSRRLMRAWRNRIFILIKFASFPQAVGSLKVYLTSSKCKNRVSGFLRRLFIILAASFYALPRMPSMFYKRFKLKDKRKHHDVDSWIRYVDESVSS